MSIIVRVGGAALIACLGLSFGPVAQAADIPSWMRGGLIKQCRNDAPGQLSEDEAEQYCRCFVRQLAAELTNDDLLAMTNGTTTKLAAGRMLEAAGRCLQED